MAKAIEHTINYLQPAENYFWHWAENDRVIAWTIDGMTICYRDVLFQLFRQMNTRGFPPLDAMLLVIHTCQHNVGPRETFALLRTLSDVARKERDPQVMNVMDLLKNIRALPVELRLGPKRVELLNLLFADSTPELEREDFLAIAGELEAGYWSADYATDHRSESAADRLKTALTCLEKAFQQYPTAESLEVMLRTGLKEIPDPVPLPDPEKTEGDLLDQLLEDTQTAAVSRIARNLLPVINIPMHSLSAGDLPIGGISDITNRGNYDKLLLSELAHDDLLLTARLVNNEALYFRREEPPQHPMRKKIILIDCTIRTWGIPHVFAVAAAIAFARNCKHGEEVEAYVLGGQSFGQVSLTDKKGVIEALEYLHHGLHAGEALAAAIRRLADESGSEFILITEHRQLLLPAFHAAFSKIRKELSFLITLNREGEIRFAEYVNGQSSVLNEAKLDISQLISPPEKIWKSPPAKFRSGGDLPAFLTYIPLPLLTTKKRIIYGQSPMSANENGMIAAINMNQRVLFISATQSGALEMMPFIEQGKYYFNWVGSSVCHIVVHYNSILKLYRIDLDNFTVLQEDFSGHLYQPSEIFFSKNQRLYLNGYGKTIEYDLVEMQLIREKERSDIDAGVLQKIERARQFPVTDELFRQAMASPRLQTFTRCNRIYISTDGRLMVNHYQLTLAGNDIHLSAVGGVPPVVLHQALYDTGGLFKNTKCKFQRWYWRDGSEAIVDKRGFLHLRSANKALPEVTIMLVTDLRAACWASTNQVAGGDFSIIRDEELSLEIEPTRFYQEYLQPFINHIIKHAAAPSA